MKKLKFITFMCLVAVFWGSCTRPQTQEEKNLKTQTHKDVSEFEHNGHKYIRFGWGLGHYSTAGVVHDPDCPCFNNDSVK